MVASCGLLSCTALYILTGCSRALQKGRYIYSHNMTPKIGREALSHGNVTHRSEKVKVHIVLIKAEHKPKEKTSVRDINCLAAAKGWNIHMAIGNKHYVFCYLSLSRTHCLTLIVSSRLY